MPSAPAAPLSSIVASVASSGYAVCERFVDDALVAAIRSEAASLFRAGQFRAAGIGDGRLLPDVRGDEIVWIDAPTAAQARYIEHLSELAVALNRQLMLGLVSFECHLARYAPGRVYARHLDRHISGDARTLSCTLYLNADWQPEEGGALRLYPSDPTYVDVLPRAGTMACFLSDAIEHEVQPARRPRLSLTGWCRRRALDVLDTSGIPLRPRGRGRRRAR